MLDFQRINLPFFSWHRFNPPFFLACRASVAAANATSAQVTGLLNATFGNAVEMIVAIQPFGQIGQGYPLVN